MEYVQIPAGTEIIPARAFQGNKQIKKIVIPDSVTTIGEYAFSDCDKLESVVIPDSVKNIGDGVFLICIYNHRTTKTNQKYPSVNL